MCCTVLTVFCLLVSFVPYCKYWTVRINCKVRKVLYRMISVLQFWTSFLPFGQFYSVRIVLNPSESIETYRKFFTEWIIFYRKNDIVSIGQYCISIFFYSFNKTKKFLWHLTVRYSQYNRHDPYLRILTVRCWM